MYVVPDRTHVCPQLVCNYSSLGGFFLKFFPSSGVLRKILLQCLVDIKRHSPLLNQDQETMSPLGESKIHVPNWDPAHVCGPR